MNSSLKLLSNAKELIKINFIPVRFRYYADKVAKGHYSSKFGYHEKLFRGGPLPRLKDAEPLPMPIYKPKNPWSEKKVRLGQNDYIDILGGARLRPSDVSYDIPKWLRGKRGNEMKLLVLKQKVFSGTPYEIENPTLCYNMKRRFKYLYKYLNRKTKTGVTMKE